MLGLVCLGSLNKVGSLILFVIHLAVVGEKEKANHAVNVRTRDNKVHGEISVSSAIEKLKKFKSLRLPNAEEEF